MTAAANTPTTVADVLARLRDIDASTPPADGAAVFNGMYLRVTEGVATRLEQGGVFTDPQLMAELDVRFARLWLAAFDAAHAPAGGEPVPKAWAPLFEQRANAGVWPIQFALAGMNAHIENDLPLAVVQTCHARGVGPDHPGVHADYERVNDLLASLESQIRRSFLTEIERRVDDRLGPLVHLVDSWNIDKARDLAWVTVETLWALRDLEALRGRYVATLARTVGMTSRCLLAPLGVV